MRLTTRRSLIYCLCAALSFFPMYRAWADETNWRSALGPSFCALDKSGLKVQFCASVVYLFEGATQRIQRCNVSVAGSSDLLFASDVECEDFGVSAFPSPGDSKIVQMDVLPADTGPKNLQSFTQQFTGWENTFWIVSVEQFADDKSKFFSPEFCQKADKRPMICKRVNSFVDIP